MTRRFFFPSSRAHHAYCMAVDFGMEFSKREGLWTLDGLISLRGAIDYKIYIAESSLHLLEPQVGDLLTNIGAAGWRLSEIRGDQLVFQDGRQEWFGRKDEMQVIQRGGIAFHWPECEAA